MPTGRSGRSQTGGGAGDRRQTGGATGRPGDGVPGNAGWDGGISADEHRERAGGERHGRTAEADADPEAMARQICLRLLSAAPRTRAQLAAALRRRGVPEDAAAAVLERFTEVKLIDDELFAQAWVESRHHARGLAGRALGAELRQRGVAAADIGTALSHLGPEQELATARELVARRLEATADMPMLARLRRLTGMLTRKGYSPGLAYRVVREALEGEAAIRPGATYELEEFPEPADDDAPSEP